MTDNTDELKRRYDQFALSGDEKTTACDYNLRELEIGYGMEFIRDGDTILDVGCGPGVALREYAGKRDVAAFGIDYSENMVEFARKRTSEVAPQMRIDFQCASVDDLPYESAKFDVVTSHRCLMALLDWERQKKALLEIHRVLKPGGVYVMMEGTFDGLDSLNFYRRKFGLAEIEAGGQDRLLTLKFHERQLADFCAPHFELIRTQRFGMYYFLTRIVQPLLVAPDSPRYDHPLNEVAKQIARVVPEFETVGHLVGFAWRKRTSLTADNDPR
jgi:ubiquinone/menaquinone biosynthesis C-methylase UbiE